MTSINVEYEKLLHKVLTEGAQKGDRTGTGTRSLFGAQMRFNLQEGFPLITTKRVHLHSIIHELLWFINGDTNVKYLEDNNVKIWDAWRAPYRINRAKTEIIARPVAAVSNPAPEVDTQKTIAEAGYDKDSLEWKLAEEWERMLQTQIPVAERWLNLEAFVQDAQKLPHWFYKNQSWDKYLLSPLYYGEAEFSYGKAVWLLKEEADELLEAPAGSVILRPSLYATGDLGPVYGAMWRSWPDYDGTSIDQLSNVINDIKNNPDSRRHIVSSWNPAVLNQQALPPCHAFFQFYVADGKLSCQLYQRSADLFLGVPFNIASYALLTMMVAQQTDLEVGEFIWTGGDVHLYENHIQQVEKQLSRDPRPFPELELNKAASIDSYKFEDFNLVGYDPHPGIKAPVAV